jgi:hypothetical protein
MLRGSRSPAFQPGRKADRGLQQLTGLETWLRLSEANIG